MIGDLRWIAVVGAACATNIAADVAWFRAFPAGGVFRAMLMGFVSGGVILAALSVGFGMSSFWWHFLNVAIYACFSYAFFHWNNMGETGRRVRLLIELRAAPEGLTRAELFTRYGHREIIERRLNRMLESRQIREMDGRYRLDNQSFLAMARIVRVFKRLLDVE